MALAAGTLEKSRKVYSALSSEVEMLFDELLSSAKRGERFESEICRVEDQLSFAQRLDAKRELDLNELAVLSEKIGGELETAQGRADGAALFESEEKWASEFEAVRKSLERMAAYLRRMKGEVSSLEAKSAAAALLREAALCRSRLSKIKSIANRRGKAHARADAAARRLRAVKASIGKASSRLAKERLKDKIAKARAEISSHIMKAKSGRMTIDHKHLTFFSEGQPIRVPLTESVRFALEEMMPIEASLGKIGKGGVMLVGSHAHEGGRTVVRLGERVIAGDTVLYREKTYVI